MPIVYLYAVCHLIWLLIDKLSRHPYKVKPYRSAIYSAGVAVSSALASTGASSAAAGASWSALPPA